ncbi:NAD(P)H-binding protein [Endozoicomonas arenosclerae]|uniref:NAD(P)H-binding protein n=1 Tax=Endozoicomonas arenosclerae TaxID=1633495 RepID=UPI0007804F83|nr:NAD(P)H-binding protein [Endozoicomonas arenosclerae]
MTNQTSISIVGYGRVGLPLAEALVEKGYDVSGTVTRQEKCDELNARGLKTSVLKFTPEPEGDLKTAFNANILIVTVPPSRETSSHFTTIMQRIADEAESHSVKKVLFISATSVYRQNNDVVREEDASHDSDAFMGLSWLPIEELFTQRSSFATTVVRFSGLMGRGINPGLYFAGRELKGPDSLVNMIHVDDCVGIMTAIIEQDAWGEVFNGSADEHPTKRDFYNRACEASDMPSPVFLNEAAPYRIVNSDKVKSKLGYRFQFPDPMKGF